MTGNPSCEHFINGACEFRIPGSPITCLGQPSDGVQGCVMASQMERDAAARSSAQVARKPMSSQPPATSTSR